MNELDKIKLLEIKNKMEQCDHSFIIQSEGHWIGGFHSSNKIQNNKILKK